MPKVETEMCKECNWTVAHHRPSCSLVTMDMLKENVRINTAYIESCHKEKNRLIMTCKRLKEEINKWKGKFKIVKHENNKLRNKLNSKL